MVPRQPVSQAETVAPPLQQPVSQVELQQTELSSSLFKFRRSNLGITATVSGNDVRISGGDGTVEIEDTVRMRSSHGRYTLELGRHAFTKMGDNTDYLVFGYWMDARNFDNPTPASGPHYLGYHIVAAGGSRPVTDVSAVTGNATYFGTASGIVTLQVGPSRNNSRVWRSSFSDRAMQLRVNFDDNSVWGQINVGHPDAWMGAANPPPGNAWSERGVNVITLRGNIHNAGQGGTFGGNVMAESYVTNINPAAAKPDNLPNSRPYDHGISGSWEGQFYSPSGTDAPGYAAGRFRSSPHSNFHRSQRYATVIEGAFGAWKHEGD